jgi:hypothetical protein
MALAGAQVALLLQTKAHARLKNTTTLLIQTVLAHRFHLQLEASQNVFLNMTLGPAYL